MILGASTEFSNRIVGLQVCIPILHFEHLHLTCLNLPVVNFETVPIPPQKKRSITNLMVVIVSLDSDPIKQYYGELDIFSRKYSCLLSTDVCLCLDLSNLFMFAFAPTLSSQK